MHGHRSLLGVQNLLVITDGSIFGHSAFGAGVTVTMVETSNVGVKVGMVGRGVIEAVSVADGIDVCVAVGSGEGVSVAICVIAVGIFVFDGVQALTRKTKIMITCQNNLFILFSSIETDRHPQAHRYDFETRDNHSPAESKSQDVLPRIGLPPHSHRTFCVWIGMHPRTRLPFPHRDEHIGRCRIFAAECCRLLLHLIRDFARDEGA